MSDIHDRHTPLSIIDRINDPIISRSNAPTFAASQLLAARRSRVRRQS